MEPDLLKAFETLGLENESSEEVGANKLPIIEKSIEGRTIYVIDRLDKAKLFYNINDVIADFLIEKTGKEIKVKIQAAKTADDVEAAAYVVQAAEWLKQCATKPTDTSVIGDYELRNMKLKFGKVPECFTWEETYAWDNANKPQVENQYTAMAAYGQDTKVVEKVTPVENPLRKYNQCIRLYVEARVESLILDTVIQNMDDKKKYKLSAEQAAKLGF